MRIYGMSGVYVCVRNIYVVLGQTHPCHHLGHDPSMLPAQTVLRACADRRLHCDLQIRARMELAAPTLSALSTLPQTLQHLVAPFAHPPRRCQLPAT